MKTDTELREKLKDIDTYSDFIERLSDFGLKLSDLTEHGTLKPVQLKLIKKAFKGRENDKAHWEGFKKSHTEYYCLIHAPTIVAFNNKSSSIGAK